MVGTDLAVSRRNDTESRGADAVAVRCGTSALAASRCGSAPTGPSGENPTITITASGVSPTQVTIHVGSRVTFLNSDVRIHAMSSDPITHTDCPAINDVGLLNPGQSRTTGAFDMARVCGFHDHTNELDPTWQGRSSCSKLAVGMREPVCGTRRFNLQ